MIGLCEYQIRILKQDMGKIFIPMYFYNQEKNDRIETKVRYDFSNTVGINEWLVMENNGLLEVLDVLENIALLLDQCKEVLINYENLRIHLDTIYVSTLNKSEIKLQYMPKEDGLNFSFNQLVAEMHTVIRDVEVKEYLQIILKRLEEENPSLLSTINIIGQIKRDVYICGWICKNRGI